MSEIKLKVGDMVMLKDKTGPHIVKANVYPFLIDGSTYTGGGRIIANEECERDVASILPPEPTLPVWEVGKPYPTRGGKTAYVLKTDAPGHYPIIGYSEDGSQSAARSWTSVGKAYSHRDDNADLIFPTPPQPVTLKLWANIYPENMVYLYPTPIKAADGRDHVKCIACVPVEITYIPGQGLSSAPQ